MESLKFFLTPNNLITKSTNLVLENSIIALGSSIILAQLRQKQNAHPIEYNSNYNRIDEDPVLDFRKLK